MLATSDLVAFVATSSPEQAKAFYGDVLGLPLQSDDDFAMVFDAHGTTLRISKVSQLAPAGYTVLGWLVDRIEDTVRGLVDRGVRFERYPGLEQDNLGIWTVGDRTKVAWFKDPDGNLLSLTELGRA